LPRNIAIPAKMRPMGQMALQVIASNRKVAAVSEIARPAMMLPVLADVRRPFT
jgi:hypothetical protein